MFANAVKSVCQDPESCLLLTIFLKMDTDSSTIPQPEPQFTLESSSSILLHHWSMSLRRQVRARAIYEVHSVSSFEVQGASKSSKFSMAENSQTICKPEEISDAALLDDDGIDEDADIQSEGMTKK